MAGRVKLQSHTSATPARVCLLLGCGYTAKAIAPALIAKGFKVYGTTRSQKKVEAIRALGVEPLIFTGAVSKPLSSILGRTTHVISSIAPVDDGDPIVREIAPHFTGALRWTAYLSATSVYGDRNGHWVFEEELLRPTTKRGRARVLAELDWAECGLNPHIFRVAGIYGPGRNAFARIKSGRAQAIIRPGHISNRIHVDDVAAALLASIQRPDPLRIYNLADDAPSPPQDVLNFAARKLGVTIKQVNFADAEMSNMAKSFYSECRRTSNERAKNELEWTPRFPDYRAGLSALFESEQN